MWKHRQQTHAIAKRHEAEMRRFCDPATKWKTSKDFGYKVMTLEVLHLP